MTRQFGCCEFVTVCVVLVWLCSRDVVLVELWFGCGCIGSAMWNCIMRCCFLLCCGEFPASPFWLCRCWIYSERFGLGFVDEQQELCSDYNEKKRFEPIIVANLDGSDLFGHIGLILDN